MKYIDHNNRVFVTLTCLIFGTYHYIKRNAVGLSAMRLSVNMFKHRLTGMKVA